MDIGPAELLVILIIIPTLFFAYVGIVQLCREKRWGLVALCTVTIVIAGLFPFAIAGIAKFGAWRRKEGSRAMNRDATLSAQSVNGQPLP